MNPVPCEVAIVGTPQPEAATGPCSQIRPMITPLRKVLSDLFPDARRVSSTPSTASSNTDEQARATCNSPDDTLCELGSAKAMPDTDGQRLVTTKGWTLEHMIEMGMKPVERVSALQGASEIQKAIRRYEDDGVPIIIEDWHKTAQWPKDDLFTVAWLLENGEQKIMARNGITRKDEEMLLSSFIELSQKASHFASEEESARYYGKDAVCPKPWKDWLLKGALPEELLPGGPDDVLEFLDDNECVETLMCYLGIGDTYTAAHKDLCASSGHNLMCYTEGGGSSFWFMTCSSDAPRVATWFQQLRYEIDHETYVVSPEELVKAPFPVFVAEQKLGDLVLVPKRSCHQVINNGGLTVKMSWSRMTVDGLVTAFHHELPVYRRVCRQETYRVKLLTYRALLKYSEDLQQAHRDSTRDMSPLTPLEDFSRSPSPISPQTISRQLTQKSEKDSKYRTICDRLGKLLEIFDKIIVEEYTESADCELRSSFSRTALPESPGDGIPPSSQASSPASAGDGLTCDFCGADIFQSFFECKKCVSTKRNSSEGMGMTVIALMTESAPESDHVLICPCCYVEGRSCLCGVMTAVQRLSTDKLIEDRNRAASLLNQGMLTERTKTKIMLLSVQTVRADTHPQIFESACKILSTRIDIKSARSSVKSSSKLAASLYRSCSRNYTARHMISSVAVLGCNECHNACCYFHMLSMPIHASEALMHHDQTTKNALWHAFHLQRSSESRALVAEAEVAETSGAPYNMCISLALYAQKYSACFPFNTETVKRGWYDKYNLAQLYEEPEEVPSLQSRKRKIEATKKTDIVKKCRRTPASSRSASPRREISDRSSVDTTASIKSRVSLTGHQSDAFVELPKLTSTKRKRYRPMEIQDPDRAEVAKMAANKKPKPFDEIFNGLYGQQANQRIAEEASASASTSKRNKRVIISEPMEEYSRKRQNSLSSLTLSDASEDMRKMAYRDSDPDYIESERLSNSPPLRGPSKRPTTFRPKNLPKGGQGRRQMAHKRIDSSEEEEEGHRSTRRKQTKVLAPSKVSKRSRVESSKSPSSLPKKLDAATVSSTEHTAEVSVHPSRMSAYPQTVHPDLVVYQSSTKDRAQIAALEKKFEELYARQTRFEMEYRNKIHKLEDANQRLSLMLQERNDQIGWPMSECYNMRDLVAQQEEIYGEIRAHRKPSENQVGSATAFAANGVGHGEQSWHTEDDLQRQSSSMGRYRQNDLNHAYARQYMPQQSDPPFASGSRLPAPPPQARSPASAFPDSIQEKENQRNAKVSRWDVRPDIIAKEANSSSLLPSSSWDPSSQPQSQSHSLENPTSHPGDPSSPTPTARKAVRPIQTAPVPSRAPAHRLSMGARRSIIVPDSDKNSESSRSQ